MKKWAIECGYVPALHHDLIIRELEAVVRGETKRLLLVLPPGSAKSTYTSILFPPWFLAQRPRSAILTASHSMDLAESFGRRCRNLIDDRSRVLGYELAKHSQAAGRWETTTGGLYFSSGVTQKIAGHRADLGLIDDPVGSKEDADSKLVRDKQWDWYQYDFKPRLKPEAAVILIMTRWHEDDLAGRILLSETADWKVVRLPLIAEENDLLDRPIGAALWPEWFTPKMLADAQASPAFSSLYQGRPSPEEGDYFRKDWLVEYTPDMLARAEREGMRYYVGSDHAVGLKQENDRTCLLPVGVTPDGRVWVLPDLFWTRADSGTVVEEMIDMGARRRPIVWWAESGHISKSIGPFLNKRMSERNVFIPIEEVVSSKDKPTRAQSIRGRMRMGMVMFPGYAHWWQAAKHELLSFPVGTHDDFVDGLSEIGQGLDKIMSPRRLPVEMKETPDSEWRPTFGWLKESAKRATRKMSNHR